MKAFLDENFLLENQTRDTLYHRVARTLPIYDYHCHLSAKQIAEDAVFTDIGRLLLEEDHYKWRLMRACGIDERYITGRAPWREKFLYYAKALSLSPGNPLYAWTHMELHTYFGIREPLCEHTAADIYERAIRQMADGGFSARTLINCSNVALIATTDDPADTLEYHRQISAAANFTTRVVPTFRPDAALAPQKPGYAEYIARLASAAKIKINTLDDLKAALCRRLDDFAELGCRIADHGIGALPACACNDGQAGEVFKKALSGEEITPDAADRFWIFLTEFLAGEYRARGWAMQLHTAVARNQNTRLFETLGPDSGLDSVGDAVSVPALRGLLDRIEQNGGLPKTIVYTLNPTSYEAVATMLGNFAGGIPGKMQLGAAWWFCDHRGGIRRQLTTAANTGALGLFCGMLTDSRSFTAYVRHDYFRRIFCSLIGEWVQAGAYPNDPRLLERLVRGVCFENAKNYFGM